MTTPEAIGVILEASVVRPKDLEAGIETVRNIPKLPLPEQLS
jgi:hypothetical protein